MEMPVQATKQPSKEDEIILLLRNQNTLLIRILEEMAEINEGVSDEDRVIEVTDFNMRISSMISFIFKWILACLPFVITLGGVYVIIAILIFGSVFRIH